MTQFREATKKSTDEFSYFLGHLTVQIFALGYLVRIGERHSLSCAIIAAVVALNSFGPTLTASSMADLSAPDVWLLIGRRGDEFCIESQAMQSVNADAKLRS